jgi:hypothetical protein
MSRRSRCATPHLARLAAACLVATSCGLALWSQQPTHAASVPPLEVDAARDRHPISPDIYGMNQGADPALVRELRVPVLRSGGTAANRYNWQVDSGNTGADGYFTGGNGHDSPTPGAAADAFVRANRANGAKSILTIPIIGYINNDSQWNCSYPRSQYPNQSAYNRYGCGNGRDAAGNYIFLSEPPGNSRPADAAFMRGWVEYLVRTHGPAAQGGVAIYQMGHEPSKWDEQHYDVHPGRVGYDELVNLTTPYAAMIKAADPGAQVLGPSDYGWAAFIGEGTSQDDRFIHGMGFAEYYLQQMRAADVRYGKRLLDYFDEHYYPTPDDSDTFNTYGCLAFCPAGNAETQRNRLRSTASLWDPRYVEQNTIGRSLAKDATYSRVDPGDTPGSIRLIPRFKKWVAQRYPDTKIALTEYNWGALDHINGALAQADVLGIFGREGLDLATLAGPPAANQPGAFAFRMYRNYDGRGGSFGDISFSASSQGYPYNVASDRLAIFAAQRSSDGATTLMIINKQAAGDLSPPVKLLNVPNTGTAEVWRYSPANLGQIVPVTAALDISSGNVQLTYPASSITLVVIPARAGAGAPCQNAPAAPPALAAAPAGLIPRAYLPVALNGVSSSRCS